MQQVTEVNRENMYKWILEVLGDSEMTAREIAIVLHNRCLIPLPIRQATAPRLTELVRKGKVEVVGIKVDEESKKTVGIYRSKKDGRC